MSKKYQLDYCAKDASRYASAKLLEAIHACESLEEHLKIEMENGIEDAALLAKVQDRITSLREIQNEFWNLQDYNKDFKEVSKVKIKVSVD